MSNLEQYFQSFREQVVGYNTTIKTPYGEKPLVYADWIASGRLYRPIERKMIYTFGPLVGNTHTETNATGTTMTLAYEHARQVIKKHVNASLEEDILILTGSGMTGAVNKLIRILGWRLHEKHKNIFSIPEEDRPVVFISVMEHHSNEISWRESIADVVYIPYCEKTLVPIPEKFDQLLEKYQNRKIKVAAICACSNVTGIQPDYFALSRVIHKHGGYCFVDFAASAPYVDINMHPENPLESLDAILFSPHKFLGGPGTPGVLVFNKKLYTNTVPDNPGGGTVQWVNPWGRQSYFDPHDIAGIEAREDGGTPPFLQAIRTALSVLLKDEMGTANIHAREKELINIAFPRLKQLETITILNEGIEDRLGIISFYLNGNPVAYNLMVQLLNDHYGIQVRGGCACAGPYGHFLLNINQTYSDQITCEIDQGDTSNKPGWVRLSIHPLMTNQELEYVLNAIEHITRNFDTLKEDYQAIPYTTEWRHKSGLNNEMETVERYFSLS